MNYFNKIPTITYKNQLCKNLLSRAQLSKQTKNESTLFYPYVIKEDDRIDVISNNYYDSPSYSWLIWLANNTLDPHHDTSLTDNDFDGFIDAKYESHENAAELIKFWRVISDIEERLSPTQFDILPGSHKKYYEPVLDSYLQVNSYKRKEEKITLNTNQVVLLQLSGITGTFKIDQIISSNDSRAQIQSITNESVIINNVIGNFEVGNVITSGNVEAEVASVNILSSTSAFTESQFWEPVSYLDYERENNESKKQIQLIDVRFRSQIEQEFKRVMKSR